MEGLHRQNGRRSISYTQTPPKRAHRSCFVSVYLCFYRYTATYRLFNTPYKTGILVEYIRKRIERDNMKVTFGKKMGKALLAICGLTLVSGMSVGAAAGEGAVPGIYELSSAENADFVLDQVWCSEIETEEEADEGQLQMHHAVDVNQQRFYLEELSAGGFRITGLTSGLALSIKKENAQSSYDVALEVIDEETREEAKESQIWYLEPLAGDVYYIRSENGAYLSRTESTVYDGEHLEAAPYTGKKNQRWVLRKSWIGRKEHADTDYNNPYEEYGRCYGIDLAVEFGEETENITSEVVSGWLKEDVHEVLVDGEKVRAHVEKLAAKYNTVEQPRRFTTSYGNTITLYKGDFGWKLDVDKTVEVIMANLEGNAAKKVQPVWSQTAGTTVGDNDIGDSYVEIDLVNQKVWLYKDGEKLLETDCVTGTYGTDRQTPGGVYDINAKRSPAVLRGPGYESPVSYWMPFNGGIGLHDATWRSTFGGEIFKTNGSHGCINLPLDMAEKIYETVTVGYPVVCYN